MADVNRLLEIHTDLTGSERGRRSGVEVLNKSAVVLITACWEAVVEDMASTAFDFLLARAETHAAIPARVQVLASNALKNDQDDRKVWTLAGNGWRLVLQAHKDRILKRLVGKLNTPKPDQVDELFLQLLGIQTISTSWRWQGMSAATARKRLEGFVGDRGSIAHRVSTTTSITKAYAIRYKKFVYRLAVKTSNRVRSHVHAQIRRYPWPSYRIGSAS